MTAKPKFIQNPPRINYFSELHRDYTKETRDATIIEELRDTLERYKPFALDAWKMAQELTWENWRKGLRLSKIETYEAAEEACTLIGDIIFPKLIFKVAILALEYKVPFGVAFNRLSDVGRIIWQEDHFEILPKESETNERS